MTNIAIASDHGGIELKEQIVTYLRQQNNLVKDLGCNSKEAVDYPDFAKLVADSVASNAQQVGILICKTGIGMCIAANRNSKIRAVLCQNKEYAKLARFHNDANVIIFAASNTTKHEAIECLNIFLATKFEGGRHQKRLDKLF